MENSASRAIYAFILASAAVSAFLIPFFCCTALATAVSPAARGAHAPALPRMDVDTSLVPPTGRTLVVGANGDFQAALNEARPGDAIVLKAGAVFTGNFVLPRKRGSGWITVESSAADTLLPPPGVGVSPAAVAAMPKLTASSGSVLSAAPGANHYRLIGIEIGPGAGHVSVAREISNWLRGSDAPDLRGDRQTNKAAFLYELVSFGDNASSVDALPSFLIIDRCYIHGDPVVGARRGVALNARHAAVIDSYFSDFKEVGADSQAIAAWNGPGPFKIAGNYLEAAGENLMFGGKDPTISGLVPSDIEILGNHFAKSLVWMAGNPARQKANWSIKNLFELKNARRVLVDGNLFEYNWPQAQNGFAILFTVRNQNGTAPWSVVQDVTFNDNVVRHVANGINVLGYDNNYPSRQTRHILIDNNLFEDVGGSWGPGTLLLMVDGAADVTLTHNTALQTGTIVFGDGRPDPGFSFTNNITLRNRYGIIGTGTAIGKDTIGHYFPGADISGNVIVGGSASLFGWDNHYPASLTDISFVGAMHRNYGLASSSAYTHKADDGKDIGVDMGQLCAALSSSSRPLSGMVPSCGAQRGSGISGARL